MGKKEKYHVDRNYLVDDVGNCCYSYFSLHFFEYYTEHCDACDMCTKWRYSTVLLANLKYIDYTKNVHNAVLYKRAEFKFF